MRTFGRSTGKPLSPGTECSSPAPPSGESLANSAHSPLVWPGRRVHWRQIDPKWEARTNHDVVTPPQLHQRCWSTRLDAAQLHSEIDKILARYPEASYRQINYNPPSWCPPDSEMAQLVRVNAQAVSGIDPAPIINLGGTDARLWRYKELPAIVYGPSPTGMGSFDEHVTVEEFLHVVKCHVLSAYDYLARPG